MCANIGVTTRMRAAALMTTVAETGVREFPPGLPLRIFPRLPLLKRKQLANGVNLRFG